MSNQELLQANNEEGIAESTHLPNFGFGAPLKQGTKVFANYKQYGTWYAGSIEKINQDGTFDIAYDDGDHEKEVSEKDVQRAELGNPSPISPTGSIANVITVCIFCCCCLGPILGSIIAYFAYGIIFLFNDRSICGNYSQIWIFSLAVLVVPCLLQPIQKKSKEIQLIASSLINIPLIIFGYLVLFDSNYSGFVCDAMKTEGLYTWAQVAFWLTVVSQTITSVALLVGLTCIPSILSGPESQPLLPDDDQIRLNYEIPSMQAGGNVDLEQQNLVDTTGQDTPN